MMNKTLQMNPEGWRCEPIESICKIGRGRVINKNELASNPGNYPVYSSQSTNGGRFGGIGSYDFDGEYVTWTTDGEYAGTTFYRKGKFNCTNVCGTLMAKEKNKVDMRFLAYALSVSTKRFVVRTANPKLMNGIMAKIPVLIPPISEQKKIADILATVDEEIQKTDEIILQTQKLKDGLMYQLFTKGISHKKFKQTKLGEIPEEWDIVNLQSICDVRDGTHASPKYYEDGIPLITSKNLVDGDIDFKNVNLISRSDYEEIEKRSHVDNGDILFAMIGTIGNPIIVKKDKDFAIKNVALIKFNNKKINNIFILNFLKSLHTTKQFREKQGGSTQKFVALGVIRGLLVVVPSEAEQNKISQIISSIDGKILVNKKIKEKLIQLKKGLMQDLLSGKVRIKI